MKPLHVLLTCHDAVGRFADCIESIENQEHVDLRLHVFDDASSDGSARVAEAWLDKIPPMDDMEDSMLDAAYERKDNSRLTCQIEVNDSLDGMVIHVGDNEY